MIYRMYTGDDQKSHIEEVTDLIKSLGHPDAQSSIPAFGIVFLHRDRDTFPGHHNAPRRQFIFILSGFLEFEGGDGVKQKVVAGDVMLVEDTTGEGHITKGDAETAFVHLEP